MERLPHPGRRRRAGGTVPRHVPAGAALAAAMLALTAPAAAIESRYALGYRLEYSDNLRLAETNPESGLVSIPTFTYDLQHQSRHWEAAVRADLQYEDYVSNTFGDRWTGVVDGTASWSLLPQRLAWVASDYLRQVVISTVQADNPLNQQLVNTLSTGPDVTLRLTPVDELRLEYRAIDIYEERTNNDSFRNTAALRLRHRRSALAAISLNYEFGDVDFDDPLNKDFVRHDYFLRYDTQGARSNLTVDLGRTRIVRDGAPDDAGGLVRLAAGYRLSRTSDLTLTAQDLLIETGYITATRGSLADLANTAGNFISTDIYRERLADLSYARQARTINLSASLFTLRREYTIDQTQDRRISGFQFQLDYDPAPVVRFTLRGTFQGIRYDVIDRRDDDYYVSLQYQHRLGTTLYGGLEVRRLRRASSLAGSSYAENRGVISVSYRK